MKLSEIFQKSCFASRSSCSCHCFAEFGSSVLLLFRYLAELGRACEYGMFAIFLLEKFFCIDSFDMNFERVMFL